MKKWYSLSAAILFAMLAVNVGFAQLTLQGQIRTRTELRDGFGAPLPNDTKAAAFTSQRSRLSLGYSTYRLKFGVSVQDVRVWGQDVSTINRTTTQDNNGFLVHEAWAEIGLTDTTIKNKALSLKIGRQELVYDDHRVLGNLDWLQQGRRHDAAVLKFETKKWQLHTGFAFNQNKENASGTLYNNTSLGYAANTNGGAAYKSFQFLYAGRKLKTGTLSFLLFNDQFSKYSMGTVNNVTTKIYDAGVWNRTTTGFYTNNSFNKLSLTTSTYYQFGKNYIGQQVEAALLSVSTQYSLHKKFSIGPGFDYTTGGGSATKSNAFDPLYGTPHKFWGNMDYYYVASGFGNKGLQDYYVKSKFKPSAVFQLAADVHRFYSASNVYANNVKLSRNFGTELDFVGSYSLTKIIGFEAGFSHYFSTATLASSSVKNVANASGGNNWAYLMINIKPDFLSKL